jgi:hypothetical protein
MGKYESSTFATKKLEKTLNFSHFEIIIIIIICHLEKKLPIFFFDNIFQSYKFGEKLLCIRIFDFFFYKKNTNNTNNNKNGVKGLIMFEGKSQKNRPRKLSKFIAKIYCQIFITYYFSLHQWILKR